MVVLNLPRSSRLSATPKFSKGQSSFRPYEISAEFDENYDHGSGAANAVAVHSHKKSTNKTTDSRSPAKRPFHDITHDVGNNKASSPDRYSIVASAGAEDATNMRNSGNVTSSARGRTRTNKGPNDRDKNQPALKLEQKNDHHPNRKKDINGNARGHGNRSRSRSASNELIRSRPTSGKSRPSSGNKHKYYSQFF